MVAAALGKDGIRVNMAASRTTPPAPPPGGWRAVRPTTQEDLRAEPFQRTVIVRDPGERLLARLRTARARVWPRPYKPPAPQQRRPPLTSVPSPEYLPQVGRQLTHLAVVGMGANHERPRSVGIKALSENERRSAGQLRRWARALPVVRPQTRADCERGPRPCPWISCRYSLVLDETYQRAAKLNFPDLEAWEHPETCSLDLAELGPLTVEQVASLFNVTPEAIRLEQRRAERKMRELLGPDVAAALRRAREDCDGPSTEVGSALVQSETREQ